MVGQGVCEDPKKLSIVLKLTPLIAIQGTQLVPFDTFFHL